MIKRKGEFKLAEKTMGISKKSKILFIVFLIMTISLGVATGVWLSQRNARLELKEAELAAQESRLALEPSEEINPLAADEVPLDRVLEAAQKVYSPSEKDRTEGFLWIDRKASHLIVTLGAMQGLKPGSRLSIYEGEQKIGQVIVNTPFDVISYVQPVETSMDQLKNDYYRAVME